VTDGPGPWGDPARHLPLAQLEERVLALAPPRDAGVLALIVARTAPGRRETPERVVLTPEEGVPGDAWLRKTPRKPDAQLALMRADVARLLANGQPPSLFGDNLLVDLDLSAENLPAGSRLAIGGALLEVTAEPHDGCRKFRQRAGADGLRLTASPRFRPLRLRGIYAKVVRAGEVARGDAIRVLSRG
jgi:MOSC domain-containing protein YiiM